METPAEGNLDATLRYALALCGLRLPDERLPAMLRAVETVRALVATLNAIDYGETEPASRFLPPGGLT